MDDGDGDSGAGGEWLGLDCYSAYITVVVVMIVMRDAIVDLLRLLHVSAS